MSEVYAAKPILPSAPSLQDVAAVTLTTELGPAKHSAAAAVQKDLLSSLDALSLSAGDTTGKAPNSPMLGTLGRSPKRGSPGSNSGSLRRRNKSAPRNSYDDYEERTVPALRQ